MRWLALSAWLVCATLAWPAVAPAKEGVERTWRVVLFDGRKVGHALTEREERADGSVRSVERMDLQIQREGIVIAMRSLEETVEAADGDPLAFRAELVTAGQELVYAGTRIGPRRFQVEIHSAGQSRRQELALPPHALFFEGQRRALADGLAQGRKLVAVDAFIPSQLAVVPVETSIRGRRTIELMTEEAELYEVDQLVRYPDSPMSVRAYVDERFDARRIRMDLLGMKVEMLACSEECARSPNQSLDFLDRLVLPSPLALSREALTGRLEYEVTIAGTDVAPPETGHQRVQQIAAGRFRITVDATHTHADEEVPAIYREPSAWVQSDSPLIIDLARQAVGDTREPEAQMRAAEAFVRDYIFGKTLSVGYASALEVATSRQGDCTEHALLLTAIARARGIPARVVTGFAYVPAFGSRREVFVPHAWMEAHIDGRWRGFDAALAGFDAGHLALAVGDGDPVRYFAGVALLGRLRLEAVATP